MIDILVIFLVQFLVGIHSIVADLTYSDLLWATPKVHGYLGDALSLTAQLVDLEDGFLGKRSLPFGGRLLQITRLVVQRNCLPEDTLVDVGEVGCT